MSHIIWLKVTKFLYPLQITLGATNEKPEGGGGEAPLRREMGLRWEICTIISQTYLNRNNTVWLVIYACLTRWYNFSCNLSRKVVKRYLSQVSAAMLHLGCNVGLQLEMFLKTSLQSLRQSRTKLYSRCIQIIFKRIPWLFHDFHWLISRVDRLRRDTCPYVCP